MIYFDELTVAKEMEEKQEFRNGYTKTDLFMYAKFLKYKKLTESGVDYSTVSATQLEELDNDVEKELIAFCSRNCRDFNYTTKYQDIDFALDYSNKYKLKLPLPLPITQREWDSIMSVPNEKYQRMLFVMLVDAKYFRYHTTAVGVSRDIDEETTFYIKMTPSEIKKFAKIKYESQSEKDFFLGCINRLGLFDISDSKLRSWYIKFVDISDEDVIEYVTDYDHLDLYFDKLAGERIGQCKHCNKLFRQGKTKNSDYCYKHRGYTKIGNVVKTCIDCGSEFSVAATAYNKCRCQKCQRKHKTELQRKYREK